MATSIQLRPPNRDLGMVMREVDEDLAIFLGTRNGDEERSPEARLGETGKIDRDRQHEDEQTAAAGISVEASIHLKLADTTSITLNKRPASSGDRKPASRSQTPTLPAKTKPSRAPSSSKPVSRSSTPSRSTKPTSRSSERESHITQTVIPATSKPASRSAKPTRKPATPSTVSASDGSSSGRKTVSVSIKKPVSQTQMLSVSHNAPQNLKTSLPRRPASASRGRPTAVASLSSSSKVKPRQNSCSPTKLRAVRVNGSRPLSRSRGYGGGDDVNPVLMGTQMVERVVNMRKLAPPKQERHTSLENPKKSSHENSGFGRSLSNRSLDMAIRHMDFRRSVSGNLRPVATSSGNQSSSSQSSDSSKSSNWVHSYFLDD